MLGEIRNAMRWLSPVSPRCRRPVDAAYAAPRRATPAKPGATRRPAMTRSRFEQYRDWRLSSSSGATASSTMQLAAADLPARAQGPARTQPKAYYDWLAGLPEAERERRFRERFDRIDANHDGIDRPRRARRLARQQRAFYRRLGPAGRASRTSAPQPGRESQLAGGGETCRHGTRPCSARTPARIGSPPSRLFAAEGAGAPTRSCYALHA